MAAEVRRAGRFCSILALLEKCGSVVDRVVDGWLFKAEEVKGVGSEAVFVRMACVVALTQLPEAFKVLFAAVVAVVV